MCLLPQCFHGDSDQELGWHRAVIVETLLVFMYNRAIGLGRLLHESTCALRISSCYLFLVLISLFLHWINYNLLYASMSRQTDRQMFKVYFILLHAAISVFHRI